VEIGPRDIAEDSVFVGRRDRDPKDKVSIRRDEFVKTVISMLDDIQMNLLDRALRFRDENTVRIDSKEDFYAFFTPNDAENPEIHAGFALAHWCGGEVCEEKIQQDLSVTIRCIPLEGEPETGPCVICGGNSSGRVVFAKAY
jgi:prolyl-tRNA synthetase